MAPSAKKKYTYASPGVSALFTHYLKPAYTAMTPVLFPEWMHPNVVTLLGMAFALGGVALLGVHSDFFVTRETVPLWAWLVSGVFAWGYMTCDNCDGIQARRLKLSSPIGELLDHGVDSVVFCATSFALCLVVWPDGGVDMLGDGVYIVTRAQAQHTLLLVFMYGFFCTHYVSMLSGQLSLGFKYLSVDELMLAYGATMVAAGVWTAECVSLVTVPVPATVATAVATVASAVGCDGLATAAASATSLTVPTLFLGLMLTVVVCAGIVSLQIALMISADVGDFGSVTAFMMFASPVAAVAALAWALPAATVGSLWWACVYVPAYAVIVTAVVLGHMKSETIDWRPPLALVAFTHAFVFPERDPVSSSDPRKCVFVSVFVTLCVVGFVVARMQRDYHIASVVTVPLSHRPSLKKKRK